MERLRPKLYAAVIVTLLYDMPRVYLNVHTYESICSLYHNVIKGRFFARSHHMIKTHPQQIYVNQLLPPYLLDIANSMGQHELIYEMQHTSMAMPFTHFSPECTYHLDQMRDSLVFQIYFVMFDCLFLIMVISVVTYSTLYFFLEIKKGAEFRERSSSSAAVKRHKFWTLPRVSFLCNAILTVAVLMAQILFTIYWLIVDVNGVFLVEIIRFIELFYFYSITAYLSAQSITKLLQLNIFLS